MDETKHRMFILVSDGLLEHRKTRGDVLKWAAKAIIQFYAESIEENFYCEYDPNAEHDIYGCWKESTGPIKFVWYSKTEFESWKRCHWTLCNNGLKYIPSFLAENEDKEYMAAVILEDDVLNLDNYTSEDKDWGPEYAMKELEKLKDIL